MSVPLKFMAKAHFLFKQGYNANLICNKICGNTNSCEFKQKRAKSKIVPAIICSPASYEAEYGDIVYIDEGTGNLPFTKTLTIKKCEIISMFNFIKNLDLSQRTRLFCLKLEELITLLEMLIDILSDVEKENVNKNIEEMFNLMQPCYDYIKRCSLSKNFIEEVKHEFIKTITEENLESENLPINFLGTLFIALKERKYGLSIFVDENHPTELHIETINPIWVNILKSYQKGQILMLVVLDATPDEVLYKYLDSFSSCFISIFSRYYYFTIIYF